MPNKTFPRVVTTIPDLRTAMAELRREKLRLGLIPTMGALHAGHFSLAKASQSECDATVATIFVNPTQFGPREDFAKYPRTLEADLRLLAEAKVALVFAPQRESMYPPGSSTLVEPPSVALPLEGQCRPGHFRGVATIVLKLFNLIAADVAYFGQKDFQQCRVIEELVVDLNVPIAIRRCPIVREPDGLAMSSRNRYLSPAEREQAVAISRALRAGAQLIEGGERHAALVREAMQATLRAAGIARIDYVSVAAPQTLQEVDDVDQPVVLLIAAFVGSTRLIDNQEVSEVR